MKTKIKDRLLRTVLAVTTAMCFLVSPMTAYAYVDPEAETAEAEVVPDPPAEEEEVEEMGPLTPEGNLTIVDDYGSPEKTGKQFITVTTKNGNIFYIIIDRDDQGENTVHFLNLVDERDILSLLNEDEIKELKGETEEEETPAPVVEEPKEEPEPEPEPPKKGGSKVAMIVILLILAGAGGFYIYSNREDFIKREKEDPDKDFQEDEETNVLEKMDTENDKSED